MLKEERCATPGCRKKRKGFARLCSKCLARQWAERHPISYTLSKLRWNAKRRGKAFTLTLEQFTAFCLSHPDYLTAKGRHSRCLSIDRRDAKEGYHIWNIRLLTVGKNSERAANDTNRKRYGWQSTPAPSESESEDPF